MIHTHNKAPVVHVRVPGRPITETQKRPRNALKINDNEYLIIKCEEQRVSLRVENSYDKCDQ